MAQPRDIDKAPRRLRRWAAIFLAALIAAGLSALIGLVIRAAVPTGCATRVGVVTYQWACLMPGALLTLAPTSVAVLAAVALLNRAAFLWLLRRPIVAAVLIGVIFQCIIVVILGQLYRFGQGGVPLRDLLTTPQPVLTAGFAAMVFSVSLRRLAT